jgi:predicted CopG family antitoxin
LPYFVDSNVIIGYYFFCGDRWGNQAKKLIEIPEMKHSSTTVWHECFGDGNAGKCKTLFREIKDEFYYAISLLTKDQFSPLDLYSLAIEEKWKILEIIQELAGKYEKDVKELVRKIRKAEWRYEIDCDDRLLSLKKPTILLIHNRDVEYPNTQRILNSAIDDSSDVTILLDAHHVGSKISELDFVTGDHEHIVRKKEIIIANTNISNVVFLDNI